MWNFQDHVCTFSRSPPLERKTRVSGVDFTLELAVSVMGYGGGGPGGGGSTSTSSYSDSNLVAYVAAGRVAEDAEGGGARLARTPDFTEHELQLYVEYDPRTAPFNPSRRPKVWIECRKVGTSE